MAELTEQLGRYAGNFEHDLLEGDGRGQAPTEAQLLEDYVAPGEPALLPVGVIYQADWKRYEDGMARHAREQVSALASVGFPVALRSISESMQLDGELHADVLNKIGPLHRVTLGSVALAVRQAVIHNSDFLLGLVCPKGARVMDFDVQKHVYESTIVYTSWERTTVHPAIVEILNRCGQLWVPCDANRHSFVNSGVDPNKVFVVPCPYDPAKNLASQIPWPRGREEAPSGKRFYAIGKWEPRKGYDALLGAFFLGFTPKEKASLFLKTHGFDRWEGYPSISESVRKWLDDPRVKANGWTLELAEMRVRVATKKFTDAQIAAIHRTNNIYVSSSHAEAWELGAFDARCAGNRLVLIGYGGAGEYFGLGDVQVPYTFGPVHSGYGWEPMAEWAHYKIDDLIDAMRIVEPPAKRVHPPDFYARFGNVPVGQRMQKLLMVRARELNSELPQRLAESGSYV